MKPPRSPRPAPRTLAATPPPMLRAPQSASRVAAFPSLAALLAGGAALPACQDPQCGETRAEELQSHGQTSVRAAQEGRSSEALREIGVAMGVVTHTQTTTVGMPRPGAAMEVNTVPQPPPPPPEGPQIPTAGSMPIVSPQPPPETPRVTPPVQPTTPHHVNTPRPGTRMPVAPHPPHRTAGVPVRTTEVPNTPF